MSELLVVTRADKKKDAYVAEDDHWYNQSLANCSVYVEQGCLCVSGDGFFHSYAPGQWFDYHISDLPETREVNYE